jgi:hypothetical protein
LPLPFAADRRDLQECAVRWKGVLDRGKIQLKEIRSVILEPVRFNALIDVHQNKAEGLSTVSLQLLKHVAKGAGDQPALACCDKHGGRNRYDRLLSACFDGALVFRLVESAELSSYRIGRLDVRFQPRAERFLPVALASMVSKYVRELAMQRFNRFWRNMVPNLRPTQGYPADARRFRDEIAAEQRRLNIPDNQLWRRR